MISRDAHNTAEDTNCRLQNSPPIFLCLKNLLLQHFPWIFLKEFFFLVEKVGLAERLMEWGEALRDFDVCFTESYCQPAKNLKPKIKRIKGAIASNAKNLKPKIKRNKGAIASQLKT